MDTRKKKGISKSEETEIKDELDSQSYLIPVEKLHESDTMMESLIYNLVSKLDTIDRLKMVYDTKLSETKTYPDWIKYYVHIPYLIPGCLGFLTYLKYKKALNMNRGFFIVCTATLMSEYEKYRKMRKLSPELAKNYDEYTEVTLSYIFGYDPINYNVEKSDQKRARQITAQYDISSIFTSYN